MQFVCSRNKQYILVCAEQNGTAYPVSERAAYCLQGCQTALVLNCIVHQGRNGLIFVTTSLQDQSANTEQVRYVRN